MRIGNNRMIIIFEPVVLFISLPQGIGDSIDWREFNLHSNDGEESIRFVYFHMEDSFSLPPHILDILSDREIPPIPWGDLRITSPSLTAAISEGLLQIGVRV